MQLRQSIALDQAVYCKTLIACGCSRLCFSNNLMDAYNLLCKSAPKDLVELQNIFASAERYKYLYDGYTINFGGNHIRLIAIIFFNNQKLFVKHVVSHADYDNLTDRYRRGEL